MLQFFRKYQKIVFGVVAFFIIISFLFFGPVSRGMGARTYEDKQVAIAVDGYPIMQSELSQLSSFLMTDSMDEPNSHQPMNLFNDGVIKKDFLKSSLAESLFGAYSEQLKPVMQQRLERTKHFRPYAHPQFAAISSENVWKQFSPKILEKIQDVQGQEEFSSQAFSDLVQLYLLQSEFPAHTLKRVLTYQQDQYSWLQKDPRLVHGEFHLFGFRSLTDWFGKDFMDLSAQFILNVSRLAETKGFQISREEAEKSLVENFQRALQQKGYKGEESFDQLVGKQLKILGLDFKTATHIWTRVLLFRHYFETVGSNLVVDQLPELNETQSSFEEATVQLYQMDPSMRLSSFEDLIKFELYLEAISGKQMQDLNLPESYSSAEAIVKKYPSLVYQNYELEVSKAKKKDLALRVSLRDLLNYQLHLDHWNLLTDQFFALKTNASPTREERFNILEKLDPAMRKKVDQYAMELIIQEHPEWMLEQLEKAKVEKYTLHLQQDPSFKEFPEVRDTARFAELLGQAEIGQQFKYSEDEETYFHVTVSKRESDLHVVSFAEALENGSLDSLFDAYILKGYATWRKKSPATFQNAEGQWKSAFEMKEELGVYALQDLFKQIDQEYVRQGGELDWKEGFGEKQFYLTHRFLLHLNEVRTDLANTSQSKWVDSSEDLPELDQQWFVVSKELSLSASRVSDWFKDQIDSLENGQFSRLHDAKDTNPTYFFQLKNKSNESLAGYETSGQKTLSKQVIQCVAKDLIEKLQSAENIQFLDRENLSQDDDI